MNGSNELVSIIMPSYNSEKWIRETIASVKEQTYVEWELIITDDASDDKTIDFIKMEQEKDSRIKLYRFESNKGAAKSRNNSLMHSNGRYVAFLDSDDLWDKYKLEKQIEFMTNKDIAMCYTDYDIVDANGEYRKTINVPSEVTYHDYLKRPITCTHTIVFDTDKVNKELLIMPNIRRGQDGATWLKVLKSGIKGYALAESLAKYRRHEGSLSNNKLKAAKRVWYLYRKVEKLSFPYSCYCFISYAFNATKKYI